MRLIFFLSTINKKEKQKKTNEKKIGRSNKKLKDEKRSNRTNKEE